GGGEWRREARLPGARETRQGDEERNSRVSPDWIYRLGVQPEPMPAEVEAYFANSPEEFRRNREMMAQLPPDIRRIITFAAINAVERLAYNQFETHLRCLDRPEDIETLQSVMAEEKFHLSYVEGELERAEKSENAEVVTMALEQARTRFAEFQEMKRHESGAALEKILGGGA